MKKIVYFVIGLIIIIAIAINHDSFVRNSKLEYEEESTNICKDDTNNSADILNKNSKNEEFVDNNMNNGSNNNLDTDITEILSKVNKAHNEIKYLNSEIYIIVNDKDDNIENIKVDILNDVENSANYFQV